jgi:DNA recombination protein RmuC
MNTAVILMLTLLPTFAIGGAIGATIVYLYSKARLATLEAERQANLRNIDWMQKWIQEAHQWIQKSIQDAQQSLGQTFRALAAESFHEKASDFAGRIHQQLSSHQQQLGSHAQEIRENATDFAGRIHQEFSSHQQQLGSHAQEIHQNATDLATRISEQLGSHATRIETLKSSLEANITKIDQDMEVNIGKIDQNIRELEQKREGAYHGLSHSITDLQKANWELRDTTNKLLEALKSGPVRGRWGEIQLRRVVELAGMTKNVDFLEQVVGADGRPDMLVKLPNEGRITVDSKVPLQSFLEAMASLDNGFRQTRLQQHAKTLRQRVEELAEKRYWEEFQPGPELVIMFIPIESCLMAAYECEPEIIEFALARKVILASPITLLGFLKAIAYGWQQFVFSKNAKIILEAGKELHKRVVRWLDHFRATGKKLQSVIDMYNSSVSSLNRRFFPAARKFEQLAELAQRVEEAETINKGLNLAPRSKASAADDEEGNTLFDTKTATPAGSWSISRDGKRKEGPFTWEKLKELVDTDGLDPTVMALAEGETKWMSIRDIPGLFAAGGLDSN